MREVAQKETDMIISDLDFEGAIHRLELDDDAETVLKVHGDTISIEKAQAEVSRITEGALWQE